MAMLLAATAKHPAPWGSAKRVLGRPLAIGTPGGFGTKSWGNQTIGNMEYRDLAGNIVGFIVKICKCEM